LNSGDEFDDVERRVVPPPLSASPEESTETVGPPFPSEREGAGEGGSQADPLGDALISEIEGVTAALAALGQQAKLVVSARRTLEQDLAETRSELARLQAERERELNRQRVRDEVIKAKLADVLGELGV
jgi:hypothetical protein